MKRKMIWLVSLLLTAVLAAGCTQKPQVIITSGTVSSDGSSESSVASEPSVTSEVSVTENTVESSLPEEVSPDASEPGESSPVSVQEESPSASNNLKEMELYKSYLSGGAWKQYCQSENEGGAVADNLTKMHYELFDFDGDGSLEMWMKAYNPSPITYAESVSIFCNLKDGAVNVLAHGSAADGSIGGTTLGFVLDKNNGQIQLEIYERVGGWGGIAMELTPYTYSGGTLTAQPSLRQYRENNQQPIYTIGGDEVSEDVYNQSVHHFVYLDEHVLPLVYDGPEKADVLHYLEQQNDVLYADFIQKYNGTVYYCDTKDLPTEMLIQPDFGTLNYQKLPIPYSDHFVIYEDTIYYAAYNQDENQEQIYSCDMNGQNRKTLVKGNGGSFSISGGKLYYAVNYVPTLQNISVQYRVLDLSTGKDSKTSETGDVFLHLGTKYPNIADGHYFDGGIYYGNYRNSYNAWTAPQELYRYDILTRESKLIFSHFSAQG